MKKNGFTLVEVTAIIAILGVLAVFLIPKVSNVISKNKEKVCDSIKISALDAAKTYSYMHVNEIDEAINTNGYFDVTLLQLQTEGLLATDLENPNGSGQISTSNVVRITGSDANYSYEYMGVDC